MFCFFNVFFLIVRRPPRSTLFPYTSLFRSVCYLLYPPLQFLDIAIDLKTFRPMSFGIPAMLFAFDQFERGRLKTTLALFVLALTAKEDFALILGPFGVWVAAQAVLPEKMRAIKLPWLVKRKLGIRLGISLGIGLAVFSVAYLLLTTRVLIPWFRAGEEVHYARYFAKFGDSMGDILKNMLTNPGLLFRELITIPSTNFRSEEHTSELQSRRNLVCRLLLEKKKKTKKKK